MSRGGRTRIGDVRAETLSMRGLVLNCMDRKEEAYRNVRLGLRNDMRSHVCWHVYGLLHRSDRRYADAIKSYKQALRIDKENMQILRDLSLLQVQTRDLEGFVETRRRLLQLKPNNKLHWMAYAVANHLARNASTAVEVVDAFVKTQDNMIVEKNYEDSELMLYRNQLLEEAGRLPEALAHLDSCESKVR
jgi:peptide alpha-N-acetyltransferase